MGATAWPDLVPLGGAAGRSRHILRDIVRRARTSTPLRENDPNVDRRLKALREVAWMFFSEAPANPSLGIDAWTERWSAQCRSTNLDPTTLEEELRAEGLLVSYPGALRFLHRSFFGFLAGVRMARLGWAEVATCFRAKSEDEAWRNALTMSIGCLALLPPGMIPPSSDGLAKATRDAGQAVDGILSQPSGPPGVAVALLGEAVVDAGATCIPPDACQRLREALLRTMRSDGIDGRDPRVEPKIRAAAGGALGRLGDHWFYGEDLFCLPAFQADPGPDGRLPAEPLLGFVEIEEGEFWMGSNTE